MDRLSIYNFLMSSASKIIVLILCVFAVVSSSCVEDKDYGEANNLRPNVNREVEVNDNESIAEDNEDKLGTLINLPFTPVENSYREDLVGPDGRQPKDGLGARRLTVVLKFSEEDTTKLVEKLTTKKTPFKMEVEAEPWFPAELVAKSGTAGNEMLKGTAYGAVDFVRAPWTSGSIVRIDETDYFVLILQSK
ncbi:MAG: hypothetical protein R2684_01750 [Pyrinomonadaceae bacterium]